MISLEPECWLQLVELSEPSSNDLKVVVVETRPSPVAVETMIGPARQIVPDRNSRAFELIWWRYVAYAVRNESYFAAEPDEVLGKSPVGERNGGAFLDYVRATTFATNDYPGVLTNWFVYTGDHCIDIVSDMPPEIRALSPE